MDLINLLKLAGLAAQSPVANAEVEEDVPGKANTKPDPQIFPDGPSNLGSVSDTSLRRYLKARGQPVSVDETTYPDYSVDDVLESYEAYTAEKAKNPYAIGMASAMKSTGDKPPLKKSTITKAHKIAKGIGESDEATPDTYAEVEYDYSEDFGMITLYKNGQKIEHWNGYFGADTVGNPLADKFVELAMKHNLNPEGMRITDDTGATGTFNDNTFNWDQFAKDETGMNESINESYISDLNRVLKNSGQLLNEAGGIGGGQSGGKFGMNTAGVTSFKNNIVKSLGDVMPQLRQTSGIKGLERAPWSPGDSGAPGDVAIRKVKPNLPSGARPEGPAAGMPAAPDFGMKGRGLAPNTPRIGGKSATITPPVSRPNVGGARPEGPAAGMPAASSLAPTTSPRPQPRPDDLGKSLAPTTSPRPQPRPTASTSEAPPQPASFKDAFRAARKSAGGAGGVFMWKGKPYQTNIKGEPALPSNSKDLKKVGNWSASESTSVVSDAVNEAVAKIACTKCDEVSTAAAWNKNHDTCPKCKTSKQGVAEAAKPDFLDMDKDGDKKEPMKKALKDKEKVSESISYLKKLAGL